MLVCEWTVFLLLTCGIWWSQYYTHLIAEQQPPKLILQTKAASRSCWKLQQDRNPNPVTVSQVWKEDKPSQRSCEKLQQGNVCDSSGSCGKLQQAIEIQLETTRLEYHNLQVTDYEYVEKVFDSPSQVESFGEWWGIWLDYRCIILWTLRRQGWILQFMLAANINKTWSRAGTRTSRSSRRRSVSLWDSPCKIRSKFWLYLPW